MNIFLVCISLVCFYQVCVISYYMIKSDNRKRFLEKEIAYFSTLYENVLKTYEEQKDTMTTEEHMKNILLIDRFQFIHNYLIENKKNLY